MHEKLGKNRTDEKKKNYNYLIYQRGNGAKILRKEKSNGKNGKVFVYFSCQDQ